MKCNLWLFPTTYIHEIGSQYFSSMPSFKTKFINITLQVLTNVVGALGELAGDPECCMVLLRGGGVTTLIQLLRRTSDKLLLNVTHALGSCAADEDALTALLKQDGLRLLWSHLKNPNCRIQASAANAICTCLQQESVSIIIFLIIQYNYYFSSKGKVLGKCTAAWG